jgi:dephospho-CoA kinase
MLLVGLTGNYGMGKTSVLKMFGNLGARTLDADRIVEELLSEKAVISKLSIVLGRRVESGRDAVDRVEVARIIFRDSRLRHKVEDILHPMVFERMEELLGRQWKGDPVCIVEVPVLFERGYEKKFHRTIAVYTEQEIALARLGEKGVRAEHALLRYNAQIPVDEKIKMADFTIDNNGSLEVTREQVVRIYQRLVQEAESGNYSGN